MSFQHVDTFLAFAAVMLLFSLLITIVVQICVALGGMRGRNLAWGVEKLLERSPKLRAHAAKIADAVLSHAAVRPQFGKRATVIGSDELLAVLRDLSDNEDSSLGEDVKTAIKEALEETVPLESQNHAKRLAQQFTELFPAEAAKMSEAAALVEKKANKLVSDFHTWFSTVMNRTTDRFIAQTRWVTVGVAIVLSLGLQIDALGLLEKLSTDAELRASLVHGADQTLARAEGVLLSKPIALEALDSISQDFEQLAEAGLPATITTRDQGLGWLEETFPQDDSLDSMESRYLQQFDILTRNRLGRLGNQLLELTRELEESRLVVVPRTWDAYTASWKHFPSHLLGIIVSIFLLSLGAPFWFNALRTLAALRPILAGRADPAQPAST